MSSCACISVNDDFDISSLQTEILRQARKVHICSECFRDIDMGERYEYASGICDGDWWHYKTCSDCLSLREAFFCGAYEYGVIREEVREHIFAVDGEIGSEQILSLTDSARRWVFDTIEEAWEHTDRWKQHMEKWHGER